MMRPVDVYERPYFIVTINRLTMDSFVVQCGDADQANYIRRAVEVYQQYDSLVRHLDYAREEMAKIK